MRRVVRDVAFWHWINVPGDRAGSVTMVIPLGNNNTEALGQTKGVLKLRDRTLGGRNMNTIRPVGGH